MSASVIPLRPAGQRLLTKKQLAKEIHRSERWIELKQREGLPVADTDRFGRRRYRLAEVQEWMALAVARSGRPLGDRVADLERQVAELRSRL